MRILILGAWLLLLPVAFAYHWGAGRNQEALDLTASKLAQAEKCIQEKDYKEAVDAYEAALKALPKDRQKESRIIRLERDKAMMLASQLPTAHSDLKSLVEDLEGDPSVNPKLLTDARSALANSQYYMTWLMRLEGLSQEAWEPEIESARQIYKLLGEQAQSRGEVAMAKTFQEDLESSIRLARMDLSDLQGLPLPSQ